MGATALKREDLLVAGGGAIALAAAAETTRSVYARFATDLTGLSALERAGVALWDYGPLGAAMFAVGALVVLAGLAAEPLRLGFRRLLEPLLAVLLTAYGTLGLVVIALAAWVAAAGRLGEADGLGIRFDTGERMVTLATQAVGWGALVGLFAVLASRIVVDESGDPAPPPSQEEGSLFDEMDALWRERIAFTPNRERGRTLLNRIRSLEERGDVDGARELAQQLRSLSPGRAPRSGR